MIAAGLRWRLKRKLRPYWNEMLASWPIYPAVRRSRNAEAQELFQQEQARTALAPVEERIVADLRRDGIALVDLDQLVPNPNFSQLSEWAESLAGRDDMRREIALRSSGVRPADAKGGKHYIVRPLGDKPDLDIQDLPVRLALSAPILRVVSHYLGMLGRITAIDLWYNLPTKGPGILSQRWHRDPEDLALVKTFLYLRDCNESNGPFCYIPGTHKSGRSRRTIGGYNYPEDGAVDREYVPERRRALTGKAGTLIFCDTTGLHKGGDPKEGARFVLNTVYTSNASEPLLKQWAPHCTIRGSLDDLDAAQKFAVACVQKNHW